jgi:hypothetical protein
MPRCRGRRGRPQRPLRGKRHSADSAGARAGVAQPPAPRAAAAAAVLPRTAGVVLAQARALEAAAAAQSTWAAARVSFHVKSAALAAAPPRTQPRRPPARAAARQPTRAMRCPRLTMAAMRSSSEPATAGLAAQGLRSRRPSSTAPPAAGSGDGGVGVAGRDGGSITALLAKKCSGQNQRTGGCVGPAHAVRARASRERGLPRARRGHERRRAGHAPAGLGPETSECCRCHPAPRRARR